MPRRRPNAPTADRARAARSADAAGVRTRPRAGASGDSAVELDDEELRALADDNIDPEDALRIAREADGVEQEASDHDRDTARDHLEGLLHERDDDY